MGLFGITRPDSQREELERQQADYRRMLETTAVLQAQTQKQLDDADGHQAEQKAEIQRQREAYDAQPRDVGEHQVATRRQLEVTALLIDAQQENARRAAALLDRFEELAGRFDAFLFKWESRDRA